MLQQQGLVSQQQQADAALRELQARIALTDEERQRLSMALGGLAQSAGSKLAGFAATQGASQAQTDALSRLLAELSGQQTTRDISSAGLGLDAKKLEELIRSNNLAHTRGMLGIQTEQERIDQAGGWLNNLLKTTQLVSGLGGGIGAGIGALGALRGSIGGIGRNLGTGGYNSSNTTGG
jgi:hypothetical protein